MAQSTFVGRDPELGRLQSLLAQALDGQGGVVFVEGEAGSGKSALVREFAQRAETVSADLVAALGDCNAQTGIGDPYLPFREILGLLTGDLDGKLMRGSLSNENVKRLRTVLLRSVQVLIDVGPDLVNVLVPGTKLLAQVGKALAQRVGWLEELEKLAKRHREAGASRPATLDQTRIFDQYTAVLKALSAHHPLLLIVDDLHWADSASISLLFHLARRIEESRILVIGTYRPEAVALGRGDQRHPLEPVVNELRRYSGDIEIDLARAAEADGRGFVDAFVDTEPNRLGYIFRQTLFEHTRGHPLFTVELLRTMQERGDLVKDDQDRWVEGPRLDWVTLPARVEGVVEERIGRLGEELRQILSVGGVEGVTFTAQVAARVQAMRERDLLRQLSEQLAKRHRLVREAAEMRVGRQTLSRYRFTHALFQQYLYRNLSAGERRLLHGEVGHVLEELYAGRTDEITVQLARHYTEAGDADKAAEYLVQAGDAAARVYANEEARLHYTRALEALMSLPDTAETRRRQADALLKRGEVLALVGDWPAAEAAYRQALAQAEAASDTPAQARSQRALGVLQRKQGKYEEALAWLEAAQTGFETLGDRGEIGQTLTHLGRVLELQGNYEQARVTLEESLAYGRQVDDKRNVAQTLTFLGNVAWRQGDFTLARARLEEGLALQKAIGDKRGISQSLNDLGSVADQQGDYPAARARFDESLALRRQMGDKAGIGQTLNNLGSLAYSQGDYPVARTLYQESLVLFRELGDKWSVAACLNNLGVVAWHQGDYGAARGLGEESLALFRELGDKWALAACLNLLGTVSWSQGDDTTAQALYKEGLALKRDIGDQPGIAQSLVGVASVAARVGQAERAARLAGAAHALFERIGAKLESMERAVYDAAVATARAGLSEAAFAAAWNEGQTMTLEEAVAYALQPANTLSR